MTDSSESEKGYTSDSTPLFSQSAVSSYPPQRNIGHFVVIKIQAFYWFTTWNWILERQDMHCIDSATILKRQDMCAAINRESIHSSAFADAMKWITPCPPADDHPRRTGNQKHSHTPSTSISRASWETLEGEGMPAYHTNDQTAIEEETASMNKQRSTLRSPVAAVPGWEYRQAPPKVWALWSPNLNPNNLSVKLEKELYNCPQENCSFVLVQLQTL